MSCGIVDCFFVVFYCDCCVNLFNDDDVDGWRIVVIDGDVKGFWVYEYCGW